VYPRDGIIRQQITVALSERISYLVECDPAHLAERPELGPIDFQSGKDIICRAVELGKDVQKLSLDLMPSRTREQMYVVLGDLVEGLKLIESFAPEDNSTAIQERDALLYDLEGRYERAFNFIAPYLAYLQLKSAHVQEGARKSAELLERTVRQVNASLDELHQKLVELDRTLEPHRNGEPKGLPQRPAVEHPLTCREYTDEQITNSWVWFLVLAGIVLACAVWVIVQVYHWNDYHSPDPTPVHQY
jgi:hypothetical protein